MSAHIYTATGRTVSAVAGVPSIVDVARSLSRQPRFAGHGAAGWNGAAHAIYVQALAVQDGHEFNYPLRLALLLHDAHEAMTGDVPTPYKNAGIRAVQDALDGRIMDAHLPGGHAAFVPLKPQIKTYDIRALAAEAVTVGPAIFAALPETELIAMLGAAPLDTDVRHLRALVPVLSSPEEAEARFTHLFLSLR